MSMNPPSQDEELEKRLQAEATRRQLPVEELRRLLLVDGLDGAQRLRKQQQEAAQAALVAADYLLITVKDAEHECVAKVAQDLGITVSKQRGVSGRKYTLFTHNNRRIATEYNLKNMGPDEATHECLLARAETQAKSIILVGTAFGIDKDHNKGDVLLSDGVLPYDERNVHDTESGEWRYQYRSAVLSAGRFLFGQMIDIQKILHTNAQYSFSIHPGILLSGGARIESERYCSLLVSCANIGARIIGGDMETAAIASIANRMSLNWIAVKGICDFAEAGRGAYIKEVRLQAARNAATVVFHALSLSASSGVTHGHIP